MKFVLRQLLPLNRYYIDAGESARSCCASFELALSLRLEALLGVHAEELVEELVGLFGQVAHFRSAFSACHGC